MAEATVAIGLGATKAGTSWLYRYLCDHPECHFRGPKELHFFDTQKLGTRDQALEHLDVDIATVRTRLDEGWEGQARRRAYLAELEEWRSVLADEAADTGRYMDFLKKDAGEARVLGDMTPAYGQLSETGLGQILKSVPGARFIFLMRDPVERLWSNIRMVAGRQARDPERRAEVAKRIARNYVREGDAMLEARSDYAGMLGRMQAAIPADQLFVGFYERLFSATTLERICAFLGLTPREGDYDRRVLASPQIDLPPALGKKLRARLAPQYEFVGSRIGDLPAEWNANMVEA